MNYKKLRNHILGSEFNSSRKINALKQISSTKLILDYFELKSENVSNLKNVLSYDLTHTIGNFLHDIELSPIIEGQRKKAQAGDFIISRLRSYLKEFAVVVDRKYKQVFSSEYLVYRPKTKLLSSSTLVAFCLTKQVQTILNCSQYGTAHPRFYEFVFNEIPIPLAVLQINSRIERLFKKAFDFRNQSQQLYIQAENILLETLGLKDFEPSEETVSIKSYKDSYFSSGRLDAEYYQKKYEDVVSAIKSTNYDTLGNIVHIGKSIEPGSDNYSNNGLPFVRVADYNKFGLSKPDKYLSDEFCSQKIKLIKKLKPKKKTILFSKDGSVGNAYMLSEDGDFITSGALLHLTVKDEDKIIPEYLTLALNSRLVQMQAERDAGGSIILHWRVSEIENVVVPIVDIKKQKEIANLIEKSFKLKDQSDQLLATAKQAVEMAIETNEETAMDFIQAQLDGMPGERED